MQFTTKLSISFWGFSAASGMLAQTATRPNSNLRQNAIARRDVFFQNGYDCAYGAMKFTVQTL